ncbi:hypothetical protein BTO20_00945 [Mycobacterium dioxanotrophicus]|jgi:hypothetical protein|uniref:Uncharacterized protein n=1 Tax=Mycobacterium dioxanotrophicus TaxID=482462 RepID=A0A1Y0BWS6_9MYCO|nr:hypothetical protein [Mycobacterium dioxanotrophicus]ART67352.1 hypothetical protein BTO20_00945 [Mycobacterium dioxanotrophicus]
MPTTTSESARGASGGQPSAGNGHQSGGDIELLTTVVRAFGNQLKEGNQTLLDQLINALGTRFVMPGTDYTAEERQIVNRYAALRQQLAGPDDDDVIGPGRLVSLHVYECETQPVVVFVLQSAAAADDVAFSTGVDGGVLNVVPTPLTVRCAGSTSGRQWYQAVIPDGATTGPVTVRTTANESFTTTFDVHIPTAKGAVR